MPSIRAEQPVDPKTLTRFERRRLARDLYVVQLQIFGGVSFHEFRKYVVDSQADRTRIQRFVDTSTGEVVGYAATHVFSMTVEGRAVDLMRAEVGLLPAYRGHSVAGRLLLTEGARLAARSFVRPAYFLACPVHPASYFAAARNSAHIWPRPAAATPGPVQEVMNQLDQAIGLSRPEDATGSGVRKVGGGTRQSESERAYWDRHTDPLVRFYIDQNPSYTRGDGLLMVAPIHHSSVLDAMARFAKRQWNRWWKRAKTSTPGTSRAAQRQAA